MASRSTSRSRVASVALLAAAALAAAALASTSASLPSLQPSLSGGALNGSAAPSLYPVAAGSVSNGTLVSPATRLTGSLYRGQLAETDEPSMNCSAVAPGLVNLTFNIYGGWWPAATPGVVYTAELCLYTPNGSATITLVNASSTVTIEVPVYNGTTCVRLPWAVPASAWAEDPVIRYNVSFDNGSSYYNGSLRVCVYRETRITLLGYKVSGATVYFSARVDALPTGAPANGEEVEVYVDGRLLETVTARNGYDPGEPAVASGSFTAQPGKHTVVLRPVHGVNEASFMVEITASPWQPGGFNYTVTPANITLGNWTPPGPFSVPVDLSPTSPTGIMLYMLLLAAYIGLANRLGWAEAMVPLSMILVGLGVLYGSQGLVAAGAIALVAGVVLRYLR